MMMMILIILIKWTMRWVRRRTQWRDERCSRCCCCQWILLSPASINVRNFGLQTITKVIMIFCFCPCRERCSKNSTYALLLLTTVVRGLCEKKLNFFINKSTKKSNNQKKVINQQKKISTNDIYEKRNSNVSTVHGSKSDF